MDLARSVTVALALFSCTMRAHVLAETALLTVGPGQQFDTLSAAVAASHDGDTIQVQHGIYVDDFPVITTKVAIQGIGGMAHFTSDEQIPNGKAIFITQNDITLDHIEFSGAKVDPDANNGAGIRYEGGNLKLSNCYFHDNEMGLLGGRYLEGHITIENSEFARQHRPNNGIAHQLYVGEIARLEVSGSYFHDNAIGHHIKSRAAEADIHDNIVDDDNGTASYEIDLPNGGIAWIHDNVIIQGPNSNNDAIISYGEEGIAWTINALTINHNVISSLMADRGIGLQNVTKVVAQIDHNQFYKLRRIAEGPSRLFGNIILSDPPAP